MKFLKVLPIIVLIAFFALRCGSNSTEPGSNEQEEVLTTTATEQWEVTLGNGNGYSRSTVSKKPDDTILISGVMGYSYDGNEVTGTFSTGEVIVSNRSYSYNASGTASLPSAPDGFQSSPFTLEVNGHVTDDGINSEIFVIKFSTPGWPSVITGSGQGSIKSGSGITGNITTGLENGCINVDGVWSITVTVTPLMCGNPEYEQTFENIVVTQSDCTVEVMFDSVLFAGIIQNNTMQGNGSIPSSDGKIEITSSNINASTDSINGIALWKWSNDSDFSCTGSTKIVGIKK